MRIQFLIILVFVVGSLSPRFMANAHRHARTSSLAIMRLDDGVYYGAAPKNEEDFVRLRQLGIKRVIDTRSLKILASSIERRRAARYAMVYHRIPTGFSPVSNDSVPQILA
ncbi:MAG: hypothetical protein HKN47_23565 [Pirellulaceae bacterium]|nr:hypothetical protein [Pirellulaceae bacterium]